MKLYPDSGAHLHPAGLRGVNDDIAYLDSTGSASAF